MLGEDVAGRKRIGRFSIRWDSARAASAYRDGWWVDTTLADALRGEAAQKPDRVLLVDGDVRLDARSVHSLAGRLAQAFLARAPEGSVVSFMLPNWHEAALIYHAITLAGMVAHPILPSLRDHELQFQLRDVGSRLVFIPAELRGLDYVAMLDRVMATLDSPPEIVVLRGEAGSHTPFAVLLEHASLGTLPTLDADAVRLVMYTSGTTGNSKGVLHTHNSLNALMRQIGENWLIEPGDRFLVPSPVSHIGGSIYAFEAPLLLETSAVLMERWDATEAIRLARTERCTHICGATPFLEQMLDAARRSGEQLEGLKLFVCGGASVPPSLIYNATNHFSNAVVTRVYGSTEVPVTTIGCPRRAEVARAAETDGRPGIAFVKIGEAGQAGAGVGEILVRGPQMFVGYLHPEDEQFAFDDEGYYRTGDLGRRVDGTYLVITDRSKDIIIRNGENISPKEIENMLLDHPEIAEVAIVGIPDSRTGERACAVVVPRLDGSPDVSALGTYLSAKGLAPFKFPEEVVLWDSLPKNDTGKVLKHRIRESLSARPTNDAE